jgi:hypothetical protein
VPATASATCVAKAAAAAAIAVRVPINRRAYATPITTGMSQTMTKLATPDIGVPTANRIPSTAAVAASSDAITTATVRPVRSRVSAGTNASTTRYTPRNHRSATLSPPSAAADSSPRVTRTTRMPTVHAARYQNTGRHSRCARVNSQVPQGVPGRQPYAPAAPPARKNSGMICTTHVTGVIAGSSPSRLPIRTPPASMVASSNAQCPNMTTTNAARRATSTARSRSGDVPAATAPASDICLVSGMSSGCLATGRSG